MVKDGVEVVASVRLLYFDLDMASMPTSKAAMVKASRARGHTEEGDHYGGMYQNWQHNVPPPPPDHVVKMHSHSSHAPPPPLLKVNSSGSGSNNSGGESQPPPSPGAALGFSRCTFTYEDLVAATNGFSDAILLGQGGFGYVHKGVLPNGTEVDVKQIRDGSGQGEDERG